MSERAVVRYDRAYIEYRTRPDDTLKKIAKKFGFNETDWDTTILSNVANNDFKNRCIDMTQARGSTSYGDDIPDNYTIYIPFVARAQRHTRNRIRIPRVERRGKIYNVVLQGELNVRGPFDQPLGHNLTLYYNPGNPLSERYVFWEVTTPPGVEDLERVRVWRTNPHQFFENYRNRIDAWRGRTTDQLIAEFNFLNSTGADLYGDYRVVQAREVNVQGALDYLNEKYREHHSRIGVLWRWHLEADIGSSEICTTYSYNAYNEGGGKEYTAEPDNDFEYPHVWPRDLHEAIRYHNNLALRL